MSSKHSRGKSRSNGRSARKADDGLSRMIAEKSASPRKLIVVAAILLGVGSLALFLKLNGAFARKSAPKNSAHRKGSLTFSKHVAPIIFKNCAWCHRPGQSAPFSLLSYADVKKRATQIADVTARRYMPPWLPEPGYGDFANERRLSEEDLGTLQQWLGEGCVEGNPADLPPLPKWSDGWQLGQPDLIVTLPQPYALAAEGKDVYRNLVFPIPVGDTRYVKGVEFHPGNPRVVHHAFINVDETRQSRRLAERQTPSGFDGMELPESAIMPGGQLLGWQPGKVPYMVADGLSWILKTNTDLVLQLHMNPSGRPETVQPSIGFYFTDQPPTNAPFRIKLANFEIDIPPGATNYAVEHSYVLPVDVSLIRVSAHAHYLGKKLQGYALLPNGEKRWLISINDWDFFWQGDYQYAEPVALTKGTKLVMHYTYDNSTNNVRNPNRPPKPVRFGLQTTDEMAELFFQAVTRHPQERALLAKDYFAHFTRLSMDYFRYRLRLDPEDALAHMRLGRALTATGAFSEAMTHLQAAIRIKPGEDQAHYELGYVYLLQNRLAEASDEFRTVIQFNPQDYQAYGNLGYISLKTGKTREARSFFEAALRLNPDDTIARRNLDLLRAAQ